MATKKSNQSEHGINNMIISGNKLLECKDKSKKVIKVPNGIKEIDSNAFALGWGNSARDKLEEIILPDSLEVIGDEAFAYRKKLKKIKIPNSVRKIGEGAFFECKSLDTIDIPKNLKKIELRDFGEFKTLRIPPTLNKVEIPQETVTRMFYEPGFVEFENAETNYFEVDPKNQRYCSKEGILYSKNMKKILYVPASIGKEEFEIPKGVEEIGASCFAGNKTIKKIVIPNTVRKIGIYAFLNTKKLKEVEFEPKSKLTEIKDGAFAESSISKIVLPEKLKIIGEEAFAATKIKTITLPKSVKSIGDSICGGIPNIILYDSIDPEADDCYKKIDISNGKPNSRVGYIGLRIKPIYTRDCAANQEWKDYSITVKSAETDEIKYEVWMGANEIDRDYYCLLSSAWGKNASFAFKEVDKVFSIMKGKIHKVKVAENRLKYPIDLTPKMQEQYIKYVKRYSDNAENILNDIKPIEAPKKKTTAKKKTTRKKKAIPKKTSDELWIELEKRFDKDIFTVFKSDYEKQQEKFESLLEILEKHNCQKTRSIDTYNKSLRRCENKYNKKYGESLYFAYYDYISIGIRLPSLVFWSDSADEKSVGTMYPVGTNLIKKVMHKKSFISKPFHEDLCKKMRNANKRLFEKIAERMISLDDRGKPLFIRHTMEYYNFVLEKGDNNGHKLEKIDYDKWDSWKEPREKVERRTEKKYEGVKVGDKVSIRIKSVIHQGFEYTIAVETKDKCIGYLPFYLGENLGEDIEKGLIELTGKVSEVLPISKCKSEEEKPYVKIKINVKKK